MGLILEFWFWCWVHYDPLWCRHTDSLGKLEVKHYMLLPCSRVIMKSVTSDSSSMSLFIEQQCFKFFSVEVPRPHCLKPSNVDLDLGVLVSPNSSYCVHVNEVFP